MAKQSYVQLFIDGEYKLVPRSEADRHRYRKSHHILPDIAPYKSVITGEVINGRKQHRDHLKKHQVIEVGNEKIEGRLHKENYPKDEIRRELYRLWENVSQEGYR